jgi:MoxR-like ATPase
LSLTFAATQCGMEIDMLENLSKSELIGVGRKLGVVMGDYARASKEQLIAKIDEAGMRERGDRIARGEDDQPSALIAGALPTFQPEAPAFVAPTYPGIKPVRKASAAEVFGMRSTMLKDIEVEVWNDPGAPAIMAGYRFDPKRLRSALTALARQRPVWLGGPAGTGKTEFIKQLCARLGRAFVRVQFDASLEAYHVIGGERVKAASTVWQDGLVLQGFRRPGAVILLDEVGFARSEYTSSLHAALEPDAVITVPETGEVIRRAPGVCFFAADNSNGRGDHTGVYVGVREQNNAFLNRFSRFINFDYLPVSDEAEIIAANVPGASPQLCLMVAEFIKVCRGKAEGGALESPPTMREAFYLVEALADGIPARDAYEETIVNRAPIDVQEILQQLWAANVDAVMVEQAIAGQPVVLKGN